MVKVCHMVRCKQSGVGAANVTVKVAPTIAGEGAVWAGVWAVTCVGQHMAFKISFSDERTSANPTLEPHLQNRKHTSVSVASSMLLATDTQTGYNTNPGT